MKIIDTTFERLPRERLEIGFEGENLRATVRIDCASVFAEYPNATPALIVKPLFVDAYPVVVDRNGTDVDWLITSEILSFSGDGEIQLVFYKDEVICKSAVSKIRVCRSLQVTGDMPDPVAQWIDDANRKLAEVDAQIVELEGMVDTATDAATRAEQSASTASAKAEQAAGSAATATAKATEATNAAGTATAKAAEAALSATQASNSAMSAADSERGAISKAGEATTAAGTATAKAGQATEAAQTATEKAGDASASATAAQASATDAASSATAASASETAAKASETAASTSATQAAQSAQGASADAQTATQKAAEAQQSATGAAQSEQTATQKAGEAEASAQTAQEAKTAVEQTAEQLAESLEQIEQNTHDIAEHEQYAEATYATKTDLYKKADIIHSTASGAIASFPDGADGHPVDELKVAIEPVQDLHGYDHPWPGGGNRNLLDLGGQYTIAQAGSVVPTTELTKPIPAGTYTVAIKSSGAIAWQVIFTDSNGNSVGSFASNGNNAGRQSKTGTLTDTAYNVRIYVNGGTTISEIQFESGSTATDYVPYANICPITGWTAVKIVVSPTTDVADGQTYDITLPTEAGTVYGGTIDLTTGKLTVDKASEEFSFVNPDTNNGFDSKIFLLANASISPTNKNGKMTNVVDEYAYAGTAYDVPHFYINSKAFVVYLKENTYRGGVIQACYPLATPITYTLTAAQIRTLLGQNNIWADTGDVSVKYNADTKLYIDNKITQAIAAALNS